MNLNKKGNIPITILVLGIFAVCGLALLTFFVSDFKVSNSFVGVSVLNKINSNVDEYLFYKNQGVDQDKLDIYFNLTKDGDKRYFYEEKYSESIFGGEEVLFSVKYSFP